MTDDRAVPVRYDDAEGVAPEAVRRLLDQTSWARGRSVEGVAASLRGSAAVVGAWHGDALIGFARAVGDGVYRALIEDVVVDEAWRGRGVGRGLVERLLARLASVEEVRLATGPDTATFYEGFGFTVDAGPNMRRRADGRR